MKSPGGGGGVNTGLPAVRWCHLDTWPELDAAACKSIPALWCAPLHFNRLLSLLRLLSGLSRCDYATAPLTLLQSLTRPATV
jgi:hypothetical protein